MLGLVDGDLVLYRCAASAENDPFEIAKARANELLDQILEATQATEYRFFLSGRGNFRKEVNKEYKANRTQPKPVHLGALREWACEELNAEVTENDLEADDYLGIYQDKENNSTTIISLDKDLLMIPGKHYQWQIGTAKWTKEAKWIQQTELEGLRLFYEQCLKGDKADNVKGIAGIGEAKARKALKKCKNEREMIDICLDMYDNESEFLLNARCLWILRDFGDYYEERFRNVFTNE
jgi:5'-3' exonuclease